MRLTILQALFASLLIASASGAGAQQGAAGVARAASAPATTTPATTIALPDPQPTDTNAQRARSQPGNNAPFWRGVHDSGHVPGTVNNLQVGERGELIQPITTYPGTRATTAGEAWRQIRNWWIVPLGGLIILFIVVAVAVYYWIKGPIGAGHEVHTGRVIERFTYFERAVHWTTAITFTVLAVSGIVIAFGKFFLLPILGGTLFGWLTWLLKTLHNFVGPVFAVSAVVMFFTYLHSNWPERSDVKWLLRVGGMLGGETPPSGRFNAGEKIVFWGGLLVLGVAVVVSGFVFDKIVPGLESTRSGMQITHIVHAVFAMLMIAMFIGHAYMGTIGVSGSWQSMKTGYVDEGWAEHHHPLWYDDIKAGKIPAQRTVPPPGREQPAA
ncbi:MAG TPA: formate dehydrogenase subunit gamma [Caldimonas sp.]|jgi:formate dehydrogenase subunit gamma